MSIKSEQAEFQKIVWDYYHAHGRQNLPWRTPEPDGSFDAYKILVSELMLQQTQVQRVIPKFNDFIARFPTLESLAVASLSEVLILWSGLGYNRRAKFLHQAAQYVITTDAGKLPDTLTELIKLPGVGKNTAGAIMAYAFNQPVVFIETNIRTVLIHHFFNDQTDVTDIEISVVAGQTISLNDPRNWYWALMDYGTYLKQTVGNTARASKHYVKQSKFEGSRRQIRGAVIRLLGSKGHTRAELSAEIADQRLAAVLEDLLAEQMIRKNGSKYELK